MANGKRHSGTDVAQLIADHSPPSAQQVYWNFGSPVSRDDHPVHSHCDISCEALSSAFRHFEVRALNPILKM